MVKASCAVVGCCNNQQKLTKQPVWSGWEKGGTYREVVGREAVLLVGWRQMRVREEGVN